MAEQWIKFDVRTHNKPEVLAIARATKLDVDAVVGKLLRIWGWADDHCLDGTHIPLHCKDLDKLVGRKGFAAAMKAVGWLAGNDAGLVFPNFDRHNGNTAKARAQNAKRVQTYRNSHADDTPESLNGNAASVTKVTAAQLLESELELEGERDIRRERESVRACADAVTELATLEAIAAAWGLPGNPMQVLPAIRRSIDLRHGTADEILAATRLCADNVRKHAPDAFSTRYVPKAVPFFENEDWRNPDQFVNRWKPQAKPGAPIPRPADQSTVTGKQLPVL